MTKTYQTFLNDSPEYLICAHGKQGHVALGFRGPHDLIEKAWYLFLNYDRTVTLHWLADDLAYISTTHDRIRAALKLFLYVNILHSGEVPSIQEWDEDRGVFNLIQDTNKATQLAIQDTETFMANLKVQSFITSYESAPAHEYRGLFAAA